MKTIELTNGDYKALVDDEDYDKVIAFAPSWSAQWAPGRGTRYAFSRGTLMHLVILLPQPGLETNHINGNGLDNQKTNLEGLVMNMLKHYVPKPSKNPLGRGVYICGSGRYVATISWKGKRIHIGTYDTLQEARLAYESRLNSLVSEAYGITI